MIVLFILGSRAYADDAVEAAYRKASADWREVTEGHPADFQYLRNQIGWREAVLSYMRDGPGIFNVAPDRQAAMIDRAQMYVIARDGFEVTDAELKFIGRLLDTGSPEPIKSYAQFIRLRREAELTYASERLIEDLRGKDLDAEHRQFLLDALVEIERRLNQGLLERAKIEPVGGVVAGRNRKAQDRLLQQKLQSIREFLAMQQQVDDEKPKEQP